MSSLNDWKVWILNDPRFGATNVLSNFIFSSYLLVYPEIVMCLAYTSKKCELWGPHLRGTPIVVLPNFVKFYLFIFAYSENFISPGCVVQFWILASLFEGDPFILVPPNFVCIPDAVTSRPSSDFNDHNHIDHVFSTFNSIHQKIKFTKENEENNELAFLDVQITKVRIAFKHQYFKKIPT